MKYIKQLDPGPLCPQDPDHPLHRQRTKISEDVFDALEQFRNEDGELTDPRLEAVWEVARNRPGMDLFCSAGQPGGSFHPVEARFPGSARWIVWGYPGYGQSTTIERTGIPRSPVTSGAAGHRGSIGRATTRQASNWASVASSATTCTRRQSSPSGCRHGNVVENHTSTVQQLLLTPGAAACCPGATRPGPTAGRT